MKCAIATVAIGENHQSAYAAIFRPSVERYVARHGYDLVVFDDFLAPPDGPGAAALFEKLRVPLDERVQHYDRVMVLDVDVLVSAGAPPFHALDLGAGIGIVDEWCQPSLAERRQYQAINRQVITARDYHALCGFAIETDRVLNTGMFICSPREHGPLFAELVATYSGQQAGFHPASFEQTLLSFELQARGLARLLPAPWNCLWPHHRRTPKWGASGGGVAERWADLRRFREVLDTNFFVHLTGGLDHDLAFVCRNHGSADRSPRR